MSPPPNVFNASPTVSNDEETRMRQALGLRDGGRNEVAQQQRHDQPRRGRHFVRDGEVPVVVLQNARDHAGTDGAPTNRFEAVESARRAEQAARERAERALHDAQEAIQHLRTQLAHAEIAHGETLAAERARTARAEAALRDMEGAREALEDRVAELTAQITLAASRAARAQAETPKRKPGPKPQEIQKIIPEMEQQPVKWWLPSTKIKSR